LLDFSALLSFLPLVGSQSTSSGEDNAGFSRLFSVVEPYGSQEVTLEDGSSSVRFDDTGGNLLFPPRLVLPSVARCFPQFLPGMLSVPFQHLSSSLSVYRLDGTAPVLIRWLPLVKVDVAFHVCG
jgi:hypothetical protein